MKLQYKIAFMIFGFGLLSLVTVTSLFYIYNRSHYINNLQMSLQYLARKEAAQVNVYLKERLVMAASLANTPVIINALEKNNPAPNAIAGKRQPSLPGHKKTGLEKKNPLVHSGDSKAREAADFLKKLVTGRSAAFREIYFTDRYGRVVAASENLPFLTFTGKYKWLSAEDKNKIFFETPGFDGSHGEYVARIALPIVKDSEIIGILRCTFDISKDLAGFTEGVWHGEKVELRIIKSGGGVVFEKGAPRLSEKTLPELAQSAKRGEAGVTLVEEGEVNHIMAYAPIPITSDSGEYSFRTSGEIWYVFLSLDLNESLSPLHKGFSHALLIALLTILLLGGGALAWARRLALPVKRMEKLTKRVAMGDLDLKMDTPSWNEMRLLAESFNAMVLNLQEKTISRDLLAKEVAERREREEKLVKEESNYRELWQQFQAILYAMTDSLVLLSPEREVIWSNKKGANASNQKCYNLWGASSEFCRECPPLRSFERGTPEESRITTDDGRMWDVRSFPIIGDHKEVCRVIEVASDVTEKVKLREEVMRAGQLASVGELAASVAHEINNPINGIINLAQLLVDENSADDKNSEIYNWIISEGNRIAVIVDELLSFARKRNGERKSLKISDIIINSLTLTRAQMEKEGITIKVNIQPHLPEVVANGGQLKQVLLNIINNARYALNEKYEGWHKSKVLEILTEKVNIKGTPFIRIIFHDKGTGIPADLQSKIVNPFFTTKPEGEGTGLGLSISYGIINDHGGRMVFDSVEGDFTRVSIELPLK